MGALICSILGWCWVFVFAFGLVVYCVLLCCRLIDFLDFDWCVLICVLVLFVYCLVGIWACDADYLDWRLWIFGFDCVCRFLDLGGLSIDAFDDRCFWVLLTVVWICYWFFVSVVVGGLILRVYGLLGGWWCLCCGLAFKRSFLCAIVLCIVCILLFMWFWIRGLIVWIECEVVHWVLLLVLVCYLWDWFCLMFCCAGFGFAVCDWFALGDL